MSLFVFDTGPLLCFAATTRGPELLKGRYQGRAVIMGDVDRELRGLRNHEHAKVASAAAKAHASFGWIQRVTLEESLLGDVELVRDVIDTYRSPPKGDARREREDWGDAATIVWAGQQEDPVVVVMNDTPARRAAHSRGQDTICVVDILRRLRRDGIINGRQAFRFCEELRPELDPGDVVTGPESFQ